ncbi:MAG: GNAT family N-acetyltransferase [Chloroflexota bacterium]|nr:GNAT family N-acetyltransferase [Chloroflexota bacterium]
MMHSNFSAARPYTTGDLPALARLVEKAQAWPFSVPPTMGEIELRWERRNVEPEKDVIVLPGPQGTIAAYLQAHARREGTPRLQFEIIVDPGSRCIGLGSHLYSFVERRARDDGVAYMTSPVYAMPHQPEPAAVAFLTHRSFAPEHRFWQMRINEICDQAHPAWPDGIGWRTLERSDRDAKRWAELVLATFSETVTMDDLKKQVAEPGSIADGYIFAIDKRTGLEVGTTRSRKDSIDGAAVGYIGTVGVLPAYRNKGIAEALIRQMFLHLGKYGINNAFLYVSDSNIAARKLYTRMGWQSVFRTDHYWRRLDAPRQEHLQS